MHFFQTLVTQTNRYLLVILRTIVIIGIIALPYYLFYPEHFIGGDDTRIFTVFPRLFIEQIAPYSWFHFSSLGSNNPNQFFLPITFSIYFAQLIIGSSTITSYLFFSLPLVLGFLYFEKLASELLGTSGKVEPLIGALMYIASPILIVTQWSIFLTTVWLIGLVPALGFYYLRYVIKKQNTSLYLACLLSLFLSVAFFSIPWMLGYIIPLSAGVLIITLFGSQQIRSRDFWKRTFMFVACIAITNSFWLMPFFQATFSSSPNSIGSTVMNEDTKNTYENTVNATAVGTIIHPLLNIFHRQIPQNFNWSQLSIFTKYYDRLAWINILFPMLLVFGLYKSRRTLTPSQHILFLAITASYLVSLYFFTINIGALKNIFLLLGKIPGWVIFRNSFDKFAPGYVFLFSLLITYSLLVIRKSFSKHRIIFLIVVGIIALNGLPSEKLINRTLWTTTNVKTNTIIPTEYKNFMVTVREKVPPTSNILSLPLNNAGYGIIPTPDSNHAYVGQSLVRIFSGRYDIAGFLSFPKTYAQLIRTNILQRNYSALITIFQQLNIGYVLTTEHIPKELQQSYLFDPEVLAIEQDKDFAEALQGEMIAESNNKNFHLYRLKFASSNDLISIPKNIYLSSSSPTLSEKTLPFIDNNSVITSSDNPSIRKIGKGIDFPAINTALHLFPGRYVLKKGIGTSNVINFNAKNQSLEQTGDLSYTLDSQQSPYTRIWKTIVEHIAENDVVSINGQLIAAKNISEIPTQAGNDIQVLESGEENILPSSEEIIKNWSQGDCNAITREASTHISYANNIITLQSENQHDACIYNNVTLADNTTYTLEFDYKGKGTGKAAYIDISVQNKITYQLPQSHDWDHGAISFYVEKNGPVQIYFYSGSAERESIREFKNIRLSSPKERDKITIEPMEEKLVSFTLTQPATFSLPTLDRSALIPPLDAWLRGDCAAVDAKQAISFLPTNTNGIQLQARDGHDACIYTKVSLSPDTGYTLEFDANSPEQDSASVFIEFNNNTESILKTIPLSQKVWHHSKITVSTPPETNSAIIYLYSGKKNSGMAETTYANVKLTSYPAAYSDITLRRQPEQDYIVPDKATATINQLSPVAYKVHIEHAPAEFLVQFKEAFNTGWNIYPEKTYRWYTPLIAKPIAIEHYSLNGLTSNGWLLKASQLCKSTSCEGNMNDYTTDFLIIFTPQRWFYIGTATTILFISLLSLYFGYRYYRTTHVHTTG